MADTRNSIFNNKAQERLKSPDGLDSLKCTHVVVTHRLSTVRHCDRILVVDGGTIAEEGTYEELMEKDGLFANLVRKQVL